MLRSLVGSEMCIRDRYDSVHSIEKHVQRTIASLNRTPVGWNDVFTDPKGQAPNAALPGTTLQNWGKGSLGTFTATGFHAIDSSYQTMYLGEQCCRVAPPTGPHDKFSLCFYKDHAATVPQPQIKLVDGGEVALWSDMYCPSPLCNINGTYSWMYSPSQDELFTRSFGNMVFPGAAAAGGSLWNYNSSLVSSQGLPTAEFTNNLDAHTQRLRVRGVSACKPGCDCDWGSSCIGDPSQFYAGHASELNTNVRLTNVGCGFGVHIKARTACSTETGRDLAVLKQGESYTVHQDFIASGVDKDVEWDGDQFSIWMGDATWMNVALDLKLTCDSPNYINMET
eukprot:TRINITY_DN19686_c0_g1_i2.p1 TRINITY_DN19686_c0_g1~~TRINITY_DN19686_c0_g1_i2.p1  ORF type:complete len:338 (+),score=77.45 TRINITY_DN19686_c0_g1_i2:60-1073(+)